MNGYRRLTVLTFALLALLVTPALAAISSYKGTANGKPSVKVTLTRSGAKITHARFSNLHYSCPNRTPPNTPRNGGVGVGGTAILNRTTNTLNYPGSISVTSTGAFSYQHRVQIGGESGTNAYFAVSVRGRFHGSTVSGVMTEIRRFPPDAGLGRCVASVSWSATR